VEGNLKKGLYNEGLRVIKHRRMRRVGMHTYGEK
jgi:hypothetical protein